MHRRPLEKPSKAARKQHKLKPQHTLRKTAQFSTTSPSSPLHTPHFQPFGGLAELTASTRQLHLPESQHISVTKSEVTKLAKLAYLTPPQTDEDVQRTSTSVNKMVNWLSSITSLDTQNLPHTKRYRDTIQSPQHTTQRLYSNDTSPIPFYTPLLVLPHFVSKSALETQSASEPVTAPNCVLRMRKDVVQQCELSAVISNATHSERSFYVAPKFNAGDD